MASMSFARGSGPPPRTLNEDEAECAADPTKNMSRGDSGIKVAPVSGVVEKTAMPELQSSAKYSMYQHEDK